MFPDEKKFRKIIFYWETDREKAKNQFKSFLEQDWKWLCKNSSIKDILLLGVFNSQSFYSGEWIDGFFYKNFEKKKKFNELTKEWYYKLKFKFNDFTIKALKEKIPVIFLPSEANSDLFVVETVNGEYILFLLSNKIVKELKKLLNDIGNVSEIVEKVRNNFNFLNKLSEEIENKCRNLIYPQEKNWHNDLAQTLLFFSVLYVYIWQKDSWIYANIPSSVQKEGKTNACISLFLELKEEQKKDKIIGAVLRTHKDVTSYFGTLGLIEKEELFKKHALRSAVAAIIGRNMSHNIGSHVLFYLSEEDGFYKYLQNRMDFIAEISTTEPRWTCKMKLMEDIIEPFVSQVKLLDNIVKSEGLTASKICFIVNRPDNNVRYMFIPPKKSGSCRIYNSNGKSVRPNTPLKDLEVDVPHGVIGSHAFYSILENFIRDTARHGSEKIKGINKNKLEITIEVEPYSKQPELVKIVIKNNLQNYTQDNYRKIRGFLNENFIDSDGKLIGSGWGQKEIKICAGWLRNIPAELVPSFKENPPLLNLIKNPHDENISYEFFMLRPLDLLIISTKKIENLQSEGVDVKTIEELEKSKELSRYNFIVVISDNDKEVINWLKNNLLILPYRVFVVCDKELDDELKNRVIKITKKEFDGFSKSFNITWLYERLVKWLYGEKHLPKIKIICNQYAQPFTQIQANWKELIFIGNKITSEDEIVFDHDRKEEEHSQYPKIYYEPFSTAKGTLGKKIGLLFDKKDSQVLFELFEVALTKILIADERLYKIAEKSIKLFNKNWNIWDFCSKMGIEIINVSKENDGVYVYKHNKNKSLKEEVKSFFKNLYENEFTFFLIHQTLIDKEIGEKNFLELKKHFLKKVKDIIIHSGRGHIKVTKGFKFVEFSNIERWINKNEIDKHKLVSLLMKLSH